MLRERESHSSRVNQDRKTERRGTISASSLRHIGIDRQHRRKFELIVTYVANAQKVPFEVPLEAVSGAAGWTVRFPPMTGAKYERGQVEVSYLARQILPNHGEITYKLWKHSMQGTE